MKTYAYATSACYGPSQVQFRLELPPDWSNQITDPASREAFEVVGKYLREVASKGEALCVVSDVGKGAIVIVPAPGMIFEVVGPWEHYLAAQDAIQAKAKFGSVDDVRSLLRELVPQLESERAGENRRLVVDAVEKRIAQLEELMRGPPAGQRAVVQMPMPPNALLRKQ